MSDATYRNFTDTAAKNYERYFVPAIAEPVSAALLEAARLQAGERVLDVACGTGIIARHAAELVGPTGSVTGVDVAPDMIDVAKSAPNPDGAHIEWHVSDAATLPLADESFDVVLCQMGLMFMPDQATVLAEMRRVLAPGGRLVLNTPGPIQPPFTLMERAIIDHIDPALGGFVRAVFSMHDADAVAALVSGAGFTNVGTSTPTVALRLPAPAEFLWQYINLTPMGPFVAAAAQEAQRAMERQVVRDWEPFVVDGGVAIDQPMVLVAADRG